MAQTDSPSARAASVQAIVAEVPAVPAETPKPHRGYIPPGFVTGAGICKMLQVSKVEFMSIVKRGLIKGVKRNHNGWMLYSEADAKGLQATVRHHLVPKRPTRMPTARDFSGGTTYDTDEALAVFALIKKGLSFDEIILQSKIHPTVVVAIVRDWNFVTQTVTLLGADLETINALPLECSLPIRGPSDIVDAFKALAASNACTSCKQRVRSKVCASCAGQIIRARMAKAAAAAVGDKVTGEVNDLPLPDRL